MFSKTRAMASSSPELDGLTPVEVLSGSPFAARSITGAAGDLLLCDSAVRTSAVAGAARCFAVARAS